MEIPPRLEKRWREFGSLSKKCWSKVEAQDHSIPTEKRFAMFWDCMRSGDPIPVSEVAKCERAGIELAPHPICVIAKEAPGKSHSQAARECVKEGNVHGISYLACKARLAGEL